MSAFPDPSPPSTPPPTVKSAADRDGSGPSAPTTQAASDDLDDRFTVAPSVYAAAGVDSYQRRPNDPVYRPLRIFTLDPAQSRRDGAVATINIAYERLKPGPVGAVFEVVDYDDTQRREYPAIDLDSPAVLIRDGWDPSPSDHQSHQQMVYAVCASIYAAFKSALGRDLTWGFDRPRLRIRPHAREEINAYYERTPGELAFGYFPATSQEKIAGRSLPGGWVFTCLSHDIIAHELSHALLDGLRGHFSEATGPDVIAFHEGFADIVAVFQRLSYREVVRPAVIASRGDLGRAPLLSGLARQFGEATGLNAALRDAAESHGDGNHGAPIPRQYDETLEPHKLGEVLLSALFDAFLTLYHRKTRIYVRLATGGTGKLPDGDIPADLQELLTNSAVKLASSLLNMCIRAVDYCPVSDVEFGEFLRALITADFDLVPDDPWGYREALIDAFRRRGIYPSNVEHLSEDALRWEAPNLAEGRIPDLEFAELRFRGDPGRPADAQELGRQARALGRFVTDQDRREAFGLAEPGATSGVGTVNPPRIRSIRTSRRVGPDGQVTFDLVAEVTQAIRVPTATGAGAFEFLGGATVVLGPEGELRYVIAKNVLSSRRLQRQRDYTNGSGSRFWESDGTTLRPVPSPFKLTHCHQRIRRA